MTIKSNKWYILTILVFFCLGLLTLGDKEHVEHGSYSEKLRDPKHDEHLDHEAVLGSKKEAEEFDELSDEEAKKRLAVIAKKMDRDSNGIVSLDELTEWIFDSMIRLDNNEADERFKDIDTNRDGFISWDEYAHEAFATEGHATVESLTDEDDKRLFMEDKSYFDTADRNSDGKLTRAEFYAFQSPEHYTYMHDILIENTMIDKDLNKDGMLSFAEYMNDPHSNIGTDWYETEKERFEKEYDKDKDGLLNKEEIKTWLIPSMRTTAKTEAEHLLEKADADKNNELTYKEIVDAHETFVGSEATNYGEALRNLRHSEL